MAWLAIFIPIVISIIVLVFFYKTLKWFQLSILIVPSVLLILIIKYAMISSLTTDTEYWGAYMTKVIYYEPWDEEVPCRHPVYCDETYECGTDKEPRTCTRQYVCGHEHSYDVDYHPEEYTKEDSHGNEYGISHSEYLILKNRFNTKEYFVELNRRVHSIDGDAYYTDWDKLPEHSETITIEHTYENKVKASHSVFKLEQVDEKEKSIWKLYDYPNQVDHSVVLGRNLDVITDRKLRFINGFYGANNQFRLYILLFKNQSLEVAFKQKNYWEGGNKNEFVVCLGIDSLNNKLQWCESFSWMDRPELSVVVENYFNDKYLGKPLISYNDFSNWLPGQIERHWHRKHFRDFAYINIDITSIQLTWLMIIIGLYNIIASILIIKYNYDNQ